MNSFKSTLRTWQRKMIEKTHEDRGDSGTVFIVVLSIIGAFILTLLLTVPYPVLMAHAEKAQWENARAEAAQDGSPAPPEPTLDFSFIHTTFTVMIVVVALFVVVCYVVPAVWKLTAKFRKAVNAKREASRILLQQRQESQRLEEATRASLRMRRDRALTSIQHSELEQAAWETDPALIIDYPEFTNYSAAPVSALTKAYKVAVNLREDFTVLADDFTEAQLSTLEDASLNLSVCLEAAQDYAKRVGWGRISMAEKKLLKRAQNLISVAANEAVGEHERDTALRGLQGVLNCLRDDHGRMFNIERLHQAIESSSGTKEITVYGSALSRMKVSV
jgi:hypothetical protein